MKEIIYDAIGTDFVAITLFLVLVGSSSGCNQSL